MSPRVLLNLLNALRKRDKKARLVKHLSIFHDALKQFNNTRVRIISNDNVIKIIFKSHFWREKVKVLSICAGGYCYLIFLKYVKHKPIIMV